MAAGWQAAELCGVLRPRVAVPIHYRYTAGALRDRLLLRYDGTPERFVAALASLAPATRARVLEPGEPMTVQAAASKRDSLVPVTLLVWLPCCDDVAVDATASKQEVPLTGGGSTPGVVRVGDTVRRPPKPDAARIHRLLAHLERSGFDGAPRFLGVDAQGRTILSFIDGFAPPHNGFRLTEQGVRAGARLLSRVHDLTAGTKFAAGSEVACHPNLSQPNFIFRGRGPRMVPVAIIDWDGTAPGARVANFGEFLWAFVHPAVYGEGEPAARMLQVAADAYGWSGGGLVDAMLTTVRGFQAIVEGDRGAMGWAAAELAYMERNATLFRARLSGEGS
jgi:hypothetical protein